MKRPLVAINIGDQQLVSLLEGLVESMAAVQADLDALAAQVASFRDSVAVSLTNIQQDIADIKAAHPDLDLTALTASVGSLQTVADQATALDAENPEPPVP